MKKRPKKRRSLSWLADWDILERELLDVMDTEYQDNQGEFIKKAGEFPTVTALRAIRRYDLLAAVLKFHGGFVAVRERFGVPILRKPRGFWTDFPNIECTLHKIISQEYRDENGRLIMRAGEYPSASKLVSIGHRPLARAIQDHHGGMFDLRRRMGFESKSRKPGYWKKSENIETELTRIIKAEFRDRNGKLIKRAEEFPTTRVLKESGQAGLLGAIYKHHGSLRAARKALGFEEGVRPRGYWQDLSNVERELQAVIKAELSDADGNSVKAAGEFPTFGHLRKAGRGSLADALGRHGGFARFRQESSFPPSISPHCHLARFENLERELRGVITEELRGADGAVLKRAGEFPCGRDLEAAERTDLLHAIAKYHRGMFIVRKRMGFRPSRRRLGYWKKFENVEREVAEILKTEYRDSAGNLIRARGMFPGHKELNRTSHSGLLNGINRHHGGMVAVRARMGIVPVKMERNYWKEFVNVERELIGIMETEYRDETGKIVRKTGVFPGERELRMTGHSSLIAAVHKYHGGIVAVRARLGIAPVKGDRDYWKEFANLEKELIEIIRNEQRDEQGNIVKKAGEFPTHGELLRMGRGDLLAAMQVYHGGHRAVKRKMGFSPDMPEETVNAFVEKLGTVEGAEELARCPDLSVVDKADVLVAQNRDVFLSPAYVEYALRKLEDMPSFSPYVEGEPWRRGWYRTHEHFDQLVRRHPDLFARPELFALVVRKFENVYFRQFHDDPRKTLAELERRGKDAGLLSKAYARVNENLQEMQSLEIPGAVKRIKNPHWFEGSGLEHTVSFPSLHQQRGIMRIVEQKRVLIADEMGTGKTAQAILANLLLAERLGKKIRTLVICPSSVIPWWREKIDEYCENISARDVVILSGGGWRRGAIERAQEGAEFVLINYDMLSRQEGASRPSLVGELAAMGFDYVVVDEVHHAKNMNANRAEAIQRITERVPYVALLSGTPIPNRLLDIGMTMSLLEPERYPTARHFRVAYGNNPRLIRDALINGRMLRVRSTDVFELPDLRFREETVRLIPEQRDAYLAIYRDKRLSIYGKMALLRLVLLDPNTAPRYVKNRPLPSPKYEALDRILEEKVDAGEKVVVFTCFKHGITQQVAGRYAKYNAVLIDGDIDHKPRVRQESQRELIRREFQFGESRVLIATIGTMSEGVDLTAASTVVFLDKPFTSTGRDQAIKRVHRLGQTRPVEVVSLVARDPVIDEEIRDRETGDHGTLDEALERLIEKKEQLIEQVVDGARLSAEEKKLLEEKETLGRVLFRIG